MDQVDASRTAELEQVSRKLLVSRPTWLPDFTREDGVELLTVILLSMAALASAWCGYQAAEWSSVQSEDYFKATNSRAEATYLRTEVSLQTVRDTSLLNDWEDAYIDDDQARMDFYWKRFSEDLRIAAEEWFALDPLNNPDAPPSPFEMPSYHVAEAIEAERLDDEADRYAAAGELADDHSGAYVFNTVVFATVLLFAGLATKVHSPIARGLAVVLSGSFLLFGTIKLIMMPITF